MKTSATTEREQEQANWEAYMLGEVQTKIGTLARKEEERIRQLIKINAMVTRTADGLATFINGVRLGYYQ